MARLGTPLEIPDDLKAIEQFTCTGYRELKINEIHAVMYEVFVSKFRADKHDDKLNYDGTDLSILSVSQSQTSQLPGLQLE